MKKMKLNLDELAVDSFDTSQAAPRRGTVFGEQCTCHTNCTCPGCPTCDVSCYGTCGDTCQHTCQGQASCDGTCNSCGFTQCADTCGFYCPTVSGGLECGAW